MKNTKRDDQFEAIYNEAMEAGRQAAMGTTPTPMVVGHAKSILGGGIDYSQPTYYVSEGVCGFAWVNVTPGTSSFARWLKKTGKAHKSYYGGVDIWIGDYNQSLDRKEAHAGAMAKVLQGYGIKCYPMSRMD